MSVATPPPVRVANISGVPFFPVSASYFTFLAMYTP